MGESGWARIPMSQTCPCVECHKLDFGRLYIYLQVWLSQTHTCMGTFRAGLDRLRESHLQLGFEPSDHQPVVSCCTNYAVLATE
jgi:hypothetical protein